MQPRERLGGDAVYMLRVVNAGHGCCAQDSDANALAACGVSPLPNTNGIMVAQQLLSFME